MNIFRKGQGAFIKITSLAIGLTVGLVLIAKVQLERNYDSCIADKEYVYEMHETFQRIGEEPQQYGATSGGIAPVLGREIPEILTWRTAADTTSKKHCLQTPVSSISLPQRSCRAMPSVSSPLPDNA